MTITTGGYNGFNMASAEELVPWVLLTVLCSKALSIMKLYQNRQTFKGSQPGLDNVSLFYNLSSDLILMT